MVLYTITSERSPPYWWIPTENAGYNEPITCLLTVFTAPNSAKINIGADISTWVDYGSMISTFYSAYSLPMALFGGYDKYLPIQKNFENFIKGINLDFYFDSALHLVAKTTYW